MKSALLCGVGGQGTVLASRIIAAAAIEKGYFARTAETIGMAQRGGCVVSHVRIGDEVPSPMIPEGAADLLIGFEPGETVRNLKYLKRDGAVIVCDRAVPAVTSALGGEEYDGKPMLDYIRSKVKNCTIIREEDVLNECGMVKVINVALVGAAVGSNVLGINIDDVEKVLKVKIKPQFLDVNEKALRFGISKVER